MGSSPAVGPKRVSKSGNAVTLPSPAPGPKVDESRYAEKRSFDKSGGVPRFADEPEVESPVVELGEGAESELRKSDSSRPLPVASELGSANGADDAAGNSCELANGFPFADPNAGSSNAERSSMSSCAVGGVGGFAPPNWVDVGIEDELLTSFAYVKLNALSYTFRRSFSLWSLENRWGQS